MLSAEENKLRKTLFLEGCTDAEAAEKLYISPAAYKSWRRRYKLLKGRKGHRSIDYALMDKLLGEGLPIKCVAARCGCTPSAVYSRRIKRRRMRDGRS